MPIIKIPDSLKKFFRKEGIDDLPRILQLLATVSPVIVINTKDFPVQTFPGGKIEGAGITHAFVSGSESSETIKVPAGKRWIVTNIFVYRPTEKSLDLQARNAADEAFFTTALVAGSGTNSWPGADYGGFLGLVMDSGDYVIFTFGDEAVSGDAVVMVRRLEIDA